MKKTILYVGVFITVLILSSVAVATKPDTPPGQLEEKNQNAPGQWKKIIGYGSQREFVHAIHNRIWERLQARDPSVSPPGLWKLLNILSTLLAFDETGESEDEELEEPEDEEPEDTSDEPEDEEPEDTSDGPEDEEPEDTSDEPEDE